jgi:foldase protein PrsA
VTRTSRRLALAASAVLLLSACGDGQASPGSAAVVGEDAISADRLAERVDQGLADPQAAQQLGGDRTGYQQDILGQLINRELLEIATEREGISVTDGDVEAELQRIAEENGGMESLEEQAAQSGLPPEDLRNVVRDVVLEQRLGDALTEEVDVPEAELQAAYEQSIGSYDQVDSRHILLPDEASARRVLDQVKADPGNFANLAADLSTDPGSKDSGGELPLAGRGTFVAPFEEALFSTPPGETTVVQTDFGWHVLEVQERVTTSLAEAREELRRQLLGEQRLEAVRTRLQEVAAEVGVTVNPRFGEWDAENGAVVPSEPADGALTPAPEPGAGGGADVEPGDEQGPVPAPSTPSE